MSRNPLLPLMHELVLALPGAEKSALARFLDSLGAQIQLVDLEGLTSRLSSASFLLDPIGSEQLATAGWPRDRIESTNPSLIHVSVTCFGSSGPRAGWKGSELIASATGGVLRLTGQPDRAPVKEALDACFFHADMAAAAGAMAAHYERGATGKGQHIDVSAQEVAFSRNVNSILVWQFDRRKLHRVGGALNYGLATVRCIWALADGWCFHTLMSGRFGAPANQALSDWMDECGFENPLRGTDWPRYNRSTLPLETRATWELAIGRFFHSRTKSEIATEGRRRGINATVVYTPSDVLTDAHLEARDFWRQHEGTRVPSRFLRLVSGDLLKDRLTATASSNTPSQPTADADTAPSPAAANADTADDQMGRSTSRPSVLSPTVPRPGPLAGVNVLDFSWALVGSITTKVLGDLGAEVIKVESRTRPCLSRIDVQVSASRPGSFDDKPWFAHLNSSKKSLSLDMKKPQSREIVAPLLAWADIVVENFSPGTMAKLGLDFETLRQDHPGIIMISGSVYGQTGPLAQEWGVDGTGAALSGRTYLTGWPDRDPVIPGAVPYGDVIVPYAMAAGAAVALQHRRETGRGCHIDAAMYEICVQQTYDAVLAAQTSEVQPQRSGNITPGIYLQGVYPAAGDDRWIAVTFHSDSDWNAFLRLTEQADPQSHDERNELMCEWSRAQQAQYSVARLQEVGIAAGVVQDIEDLLEHDPQIKFREALTHLDHPFLGAFGHVRTPITFSRSTVTPFRPPSIGEHSAEIAERLAGLTPVRIAELRQLGVFE
jgi:crotonobetainyl-CoA:carnitine CoA-transferase CaiB-like acyl-CoA transferase